jgi:hypothetical protein
MAPEQGFWEWFEVEMARQGFRSVRQVERAGRVGNDTISGRQRSGLEPTYTIIRAIAAAFGMSFEEVEDVARASESRSPEGSPAAQPVGQNLTLRELWGIVSDMPVEDQRAVLDYALFRRSRSDEREEGRRGARDGARPGPEATP